MLNHGVCLIVDEAHGALYNFSPNLPKTAIEQGADISDYFNIAIQNIAIPIAEGQIDISDSSELTNAYNTAITNISALYDQYILDCVS